MKVEEKESPVKVDRLALGRSKDCPFRVTGEKAGNVSTETCVRANVVLQLLEVLYRCFSFLRERGSNNGGEDEVLKRG